MIVIEVREARLAFSMYMQYVLRKISTIIIGTRKALQILNAPGLGTNLHKVIQITNGLDQLDSYLKLK